MDFGRISRRHLLQGSAALTLGMLIALAVSSLMMWIGLLAGRGMQRIRR